MDIFTKKKRSEVMSKIKGKDTKMEVFLRKMLWENGYRYRKNSTKYFGKPDITLKKENTVIFTDSCFWHGCKKHFKQPSTRKLFWKKKIERNIERDKEVNAHYRKSGWKIIRIREHQLKKNPEKVIEKVLKRLK